MPIVDQVKWSINITHDFFLNSRDQFKNAASRLWHYPNLKHNIHLTLTNIWQGLQQPFVGKRAVTLALQHSSQLKSLFKQTAFANLYTYAGPIIVYEGILKPVLRFTPIEEDSYLQQSLDTIARIFFLRIAIKLFIDNTAYSACVTKIIISNLAENSSDLGCECPAIKKVKAGFGSPFYFLGNTIFAFAVTKTLGIYPGYALKSLIYGRNLVETTQSAKGMCTVHRNTELNNNHAYCFGFGASLLTVVSCSQFLVVSITGVNSSFVEDALFSYFLHGFTVLSLLNKKPLPGVEGGLDFFKFSNSLVNKGLTQSTGLLASQLADAKLRQQHQGNLKALANFLPLKLALGVLIEKNYRSLKKLVQTPAISLLIDLNQDSLNKGLLTVAELRSWPLWLADYAPSFIASKDTKLLLKIIEDHGWNKRLQAIEYLSLLAIRSREVSEHISAKFYEKPVLLPQYYNGQTEPNSEDDEWCQVSAVNLEDEEKPRPSALQQNSFIRKVLNNPFHKIIHDPINESAETNYRLPKAKLTSESR